MTWTQRLKTAYEAFKRMAIPLYVFYILFNIIVFTISITAVLSFFLPFISSNGFNPLHYSLSYGDPFTPVPPGLDYGFTSTPLGDISYLLYSLRPFLGGILTVIILFWLITSLFLAGIFHLTKKALTDNAHFRDLRFEGFTRLLGFNGLMLLVGILILVVGISIASSFQSEYSLFLFAAFSLLALFVVGLFLSPWFFSAPFYMLNNLKMSFGESLKASWGFFRRHMAPLWGGFLTVFVAQLVSSFLSESSPTLGLIIALVILPFLTIIPIVWVLTLEEEDTEFDSGISFTVHDSFNTAPFTKEPHAKESHAKDPISPQTNSAFEFNQGIRNATARPEPPKPEPQTSTNSETPTSTSSDAPKDSTTPNDSTTVSPIYNPPRDPYAMPSDPYDPYAMPQSPYTSPPIPSEEDIDEAINFCPTCGKKVRDGAYYCSQCGIKL